MGKINWYIHRLKAMSIGEVSWRIAQRRLQQKETHQYGKNPIPITHILPSNSALRISSRALAIDYDNQPYELSTTIPLLGGADYEVYKTQWSAGFNTPNKWPLVFSYSLDYRQRDDIGDARMNWELNRHYQFALLAKDYYASRERKYLDSLTELFYDWNEKNPFLWGISWTSSMEIAIRVSNWCFTYCFLEKANNVNTSLLEALHNGILNMTLYLVNHYSRYSSANNHIIVEMYAIGMVGILTGHKAWIDLAVNTLTQELPRQNYSDGVNKEMSLHYQAFYMEAMGLLMRMMKKNEIVVPTEWTTYLSKMSKYMSDCLDGKGNPIESGDNDEGKILYLGAAHLNYYEYVLELMSFLLPERYVDALVVEDENRTCLFTLEDEEKMMEKPLYHTAGSVCYKEGGSSILKSRDGRAVVGIDHGALGFGSLAAHGHSDALSFVMLVDNMPIFVDPGTYIYHCEIDYRNAFRKTQNHNTVCINNKDQSEMLGAFLWGRKAKCKLISCDLEGDKQIVEAKHDGYAPIIHKRRFTLEDGQLVIYDSLSEKADAVATLVLHPAVEIKEGDEQTITLIREDSQISVRVEGGKIYLSEADFSPTYGIKMKTKAIKINIEDKNLLTSITW